jgi:hypothetical protein
MDSLCHLNLPKILKEHFAFDELITLSLGLRLAR